MCTNAYSDILPHFKHCLTKIFLCRSSFVFLSLASSDAATRIQGC